MNKPLQPLVHDAIAVLRAPTQAWSATDGSIGSSAIHGYYFSDIRLVSSCTVQVGGQPGELIATMLNGADSITFVSLQRHLDDDGADPHLRSVQTRTATTSGVSEELIITSHLGQELRTVVEVSLLVDLSDMDRLKAGLGRSEVVPVPTVGEDSVCWSNASVNACLTALGATISESGDGKVRLVWDVTVPAGGQSVVRWGITASDTRAVVRGVETPPPWSIPDTASLDDRLGRWVDSALDDLDALRLATTDSPDHIFLAAGAPWFFTLFGRDSIWAARMMLPLGTEIAAGTLRVLAEMQGKVEVDDTAEQPGKILHELRRDTLSIPGEGIVLPPLYFGTVDATPLWVCLLHDAWRWGMPEDEVRALLPAMIGALDWMRDYGDADGDGLLEYSDRTGGLSNQGWKDSGDSVQWRDGTLATGPIALCEVQAYAYEAATHGADLLDHFGLPGSDKWRSWAAALRIRFHETFWVDSPDGAYPAIALDADKRPVDTVTSNIGHLLGTELLDADQAALVAGRLVSPELNSGFGLRTMSTDSSGYWPLGYHCGSVWTHDTAIAITGLTAEGFAAEADVLVSGLLAASAGFDHRMPELHSGDSAQVMTQPVAYPAACRPQAWSSAAAISVLASVQGLEPVSA